METCAEPPLLPDLSDEQLQAVLELIALQTGLPLIATYKEACIRRRIAARVRRSGCSDVAQYLVLLARDPAESTRLQSTLLIHVSQFFRNPSLFNALQERVLPELVARMTASGQSVLRLLSLGCAAGEEPYSLAMLLLESFAPLVQQGTVQLLASDIDRTVLARAEAGCYQEGALKEVSSERRERFFEPVAGGWQLRPQVKELVTFRWMDLQQLDDCPAADLILCRNTLIYFQRRTQENILRALADMLPQHGILVLGKAESMPSAVRERFDTFDLEERIYCRR